MLDQKEYVLGVYWTLSQPKLLAEGIEFPDSCIRL